MLLIIAVIGIIAAFMSCFLFNWSYYVILYAFSDFVLFTLEWVIKLVYTAVLIIVFFAILFYIYQCFQSQVIPVVHYSDENFYQIIASAAPIIKQCYIPTFMWGHCGHIQTIIFALWGRFNCPYVRGERITLKLADGATMSYDIFHSDNEQSNEDIMFFVAPGFANNSETDYIRTFMQYVTGLGYRCAVLNHLGTLPEVPVTSPRIFSFGNTNDLHAALTDYISKYPKAKVILFGYSLGGNIVPKYLGEKRERSPNIIAGFSICSLLDANRAINRSEQSRVLKYFYQYFLARSIKNIMYRHRDILLSDEVVRRHNLDVKSIFNAMSLVKFDECYTRRIYNFDSLKDYYNWSSAIHYLDGIKVPMIFINCLDDPLLSEKMMNPAREFAKRRRKVIAIELKYGGHLGFFENNCFISESITWLEKALIQLAEAIYKDYKLQHSIEQRQE